MFSIRVPLCLCALIFSIALLTLPSAAQAALKSNAGTDQTVAVDVPVILDGSGSTGATTYFWHQTSGSHQAMIGFDRQKAMVMSAAAGTYVFTLTVGDGSTTSDDTMTITVTSRSGTTRYVDGTLNADTTTYSIADRNGSGTDGLGYKLIQTAVTAATAGDTIYIRAGTYTNTTVNGGLQPFVKFSTNGTATAPIRLQNYNGEHVILNGTGFSDADGNSDGLADGALISGIDERLIWIAADYIQVVGLDIQNSGKYGVYWEKSHSYMTECIIHDNWLPGMWMVGNVVGGTMTGNVVRFCESYRNRHGGGAWFGPATATSTTTMTLNAFADCLFYNNGFQPNGVRVLGADGDPEGGGNSDALTVNKFAIQTINTQTSGTLTVGKLYSLVTFVSGDDFTNVGAATNTNFTWFEATGTTPANWTHGSTVSELFNFMPLNFLVRNIGYHDADDGFDMSFADSLVEDNYSLGNGPTASQGFKIFQKTKNLIFRGNVSYFDLQRGLDNRFIDGETNSAWNNTIIRNQAQGLFNFAIGSSVKNNVCAFDVLLDFSSSDGGGHNWAKDGSNVAPGYTGDPKLVNDNLGNPLVNNGGGGGTNTGPSANYFLNLNFDPNAQVATKLDFVRSQIAAAFTPASGSGLIDAGLVIPGYHCPTADDDPSSPADPNDSRRHWYGSAPDIGAFEYGAPQNDSPSTPSNVHLL